MVFQGKQNSVLFRNRQTLLDAINVAQVTVDAARHYLTSSQDYADKVADYANISKVTDSFLNMRKGFLNRRLIQDSKDKSIFLDIIEWESLEDAEGAAQALGGLADVVLLLRGEIDQVDVVEVVDPGAL